MFILTQTFSLSDDVRRLRAKNLPRLPIDFAGFDWGTDQRQVESLEVFVGNVSVPLGDLFAVSTSGDRCDGRWRFEGDLNHVRFLGAGLAAGTIDVDGNVGSHLGSGMRGGAIHVQGDASVFVGAHMRGGQIHIDGNAGDRLGAAYVGSKIGMRGGQIIVRGNAGRKVGSGMRRGWITVGGDCGELAGYRMRAGSLFVFGRCGKYPGADMRRGTIALFGSERPELLPTFRSAGQAELTIVRMMLRELQRTGLSLSSASKFELFQGDLLEGGRGEILLPAPD